MSRDSQTPVIHRPQEFEASGSRPGFSPGSLFLAGGLPLAVVAGFLYLGGWFSPRALTPTKFVDGFQEVAGVHPGFRRNHAKGLGVRGVFESNGQGTRLSKASVFRPGQVPLVGRFSLSGGNPYQADAPDKVRGMALQFSLPGGEIWRTAMVNLPVFPVSTPEAFFEQMIASKPDPATGKPDPQKMQAFAASHPMNAQVAELLKNRPVSSGFENSTFYGLNAFRFTNGEGVTVPVRWMVTPVQPFEPASNSATDEDKNYLFEALIKELEQHRLEWKLVLIVGEPGDPTNDASIPWPQERQQVEVGTITLNEVQSGEESPATNITFDPLMLPAGITPSDDPLLSARSAVYSRSFTRREGETRGPNPITAAEVPQGE